MSFFGDIFAGKASMEAAKYNKGIMDRNALMQEQQAEQIMSVHNNYSLPKFDKTVEQIQWQTTVAYLSSGVALEGTALDTLYANAIELETDRDIMQYNAENARDQKYNEAIQSRADGELALWRGKVAKKASYYAAGQSLLETGMMIHNA